MDPIRVLILDLPALLRDIVRETLRPDDGIVVLGDAPADASLEEAVEQTGASVVIVGRGHPEAVDMPPALVRRARLRVLAVAADGRESVMYELQPHRRELGELSPDGLLDAVRANAGH